MTSLERSATGKLFHATGPQNSCHRRFSVCMEQTAGTRWLIGLRLLKGRYHSNQYLLIQSTQAPQKTIPHFPQPQPQNFVYLSGLQLTPSIHKYCTRSYSKVFQGEVVQSAADRRDRPHTVGNGRYHFTGRPRDWPPVTGKWQNKTCILTQISSSVTAVDRRSTWTMSKIDKR